MATQKTAAMIVIGNEILSGRTQDKNINYVANALSEKGVNLREVRIVPDIEVEIIDAARAMSAKYDYVFTSGGIGPTHDDITAACIAKAFDRELETNKEAYAILEAHYGVDEFTPARQRMTKMPVGAALIPNPVSGAPGFVIENVHVMAGVPRIMQAMMDDVAANIQGGDVVHSLTVACPLMESVIAQGLGDIQDQYTDIDIGSYPQFRDGVLSVNVVLRGTDQDKLKIVADEVQSLIDALVAT